MVKKVTPSLICFLHLLFSSTCLAAFCLELAFISEYWYPWSWMVPIGLCLIVGLTLIRKNSLMAKTWLVIHIVTTLCAWISWILVTFTSIGLTKSFINGSSIACSSIPGHDHHMSPLHSIQRCPLDAVDTSACKDHAAWYFSPNYPRMVCPGQIEEWQFPLMLLCLVTTGVKWLGILFVVTHRYVEVCFIAFSIFVLIAFYGIIGAIFGSSCYLIMSISGRENGIFH